MSRAVLIVPAGGLGTRLQASMPKLLVPVAGTPMIDRLLVLYGDIARRTVVVTSPGAHRAVTDHLRHRDDVDVVVQEQPTGMLDAVLLASAAAIAGDPAHVWITWCDQVAVHPLTVERLTRLAGDNPEAAIVMPTVRSRDPYIHLERDQAGRICRVLHRREGDAMPPSGESDMGLFALSARAFFSWLPEYATEAETGHATRERNFLPFIPWVARRAAVVTFPSEHAEEAIGVNTPDDLARVEAYLAARDL